MSWEGWRVSRKGYCERSLHVYREALQSLTHVSRCRAIDHGFTAHMDTCEVCGDWVPVALLCISVDELILAEFARDTNIHTFFLNVIYMFKIEF